MADPARNPPREADPQRRPMLILGAVAIGGIFLAILIGVVFTTTTGETVALLVGGLASVLGVCLAFYAVGHSEDRERAQRTPDS
jgi:peptidoglycan/LPS O-acetylase OafA/YrhL